MAMHTRPSDGTSANDNLTEKEFKELQYEADPELLSLLKGLEDRQRKEALELAAEHERAFHLSGNDPQTLEHHHELAYMQEQRFIDERERYVHDYYAAQELLHQMRQEAEVKRTAGLGGERPAEIKSGLETNRTLGETSMPQDTEFTAKVDFIQDPEFLALEKKLIERQEKDRKALEERQTEQRIELGKQPGVTRENLDENYNRQLQERETQSKSFKAEHDRHIREYHKAKAIRAEMNEPSREEQLQQERDDNEPKITR